MPFRRLRFALGGFLLFLPFSPIPAVAQAQPNWCTKSPETYTVEGQRIVFSPACREHDICYFTIGAEQPGCDLAFRNNLRRICDQAAAQTSQPIRDKCYYRAGIYYNAVSGSGKIGIFTGEIAKKSHRLAQTESGEVRQRLVNRFGSLNPDYNATIAWELARRQASGESVDESKDNAFNTIAIVSINNYSLRIEDTDSDYREGNCSMSFDKDGLIAYFCTVNNTSFNGSTFIDDEGNIEISSSPARVILKGLKDGSIKGRWLITGTLLRGNIILKPK